MPTVWWFDRSRIWKVPGNKFIECMLTLFWIGTNASDFCFWSHRLLLPRFLGLDLGPIFCCLWHWYFQCHRHCQLHRHCHLICSDDKVSMFVRQFLGNLLRQCYNFPLNRNNKFGQVSWITFYSTSPTHVLYVKCHTHIVFASYICYVQLFTSVIERK